ncbi:MAG: cyclopropane fatty acyl phospholipid synthase [Calditrichaeota bacterium]|nr:MAG: cyclopropane fatty acyl phospholipid synthase [Calditrichota bacterium]
MHSARFYRKMEQLLATADVKIGGNRPWDIQVRNPNLFGRVMTQGSLGLGEAYMDGWWDCEKLDEFFYKVLRARLDQKVRSLVDVYDVIRAALWNLQKGSRAFQIGKHHYDIGNKLYRYMLDRRLIYSCGYWKNASTLDEAQEAKLELICQKLDLQPGMKVLDIGCGWGGAARYMAERYQVEVVGITVSQEQVAFARAYCQGLPVDIRLQDYRDLQGTYDRIFSVGMIEHVGYKNYRTFMRIVRDHLAEDGLFLLHTIGGNRSVTRTDPWVARYIFPNSMIPSARQLAGAAEDLFVLEDWHNFGADYDRTLMHWFQNFHNHWEDLKQDYDERFYRMWKYYLLSSAGSFRARKNQVWQIVLSPHGVLGGWRLRHSKYETTGMYASWEK